MHKTCRSSKKGGGILGSCTGGGKRRIRERPRGGKRCSKHSKSNRRNHTQYHQLQNSPLTPSPTPFALNPPGRPHISVQCLPRGKAARYILLFFAPPAPGPLLGWLGALDGKSSAGFIQGFYRSACLGPLGSVFWPPLPWLGGTPCPSA